MKDTLAHWNAVRSFDNHDPLVAYHDAIEPVELKNVNSPNPCEDAAQLCHELIQIGCAEKKDSAGSLLILKKKKDLPKEFQDQKRKFLSSQGNP